MKEVKVLLELTKVSLYSRIFRDSSAYHRHQDSTTYNNMASKHNCQCAFQPLTLRSNTATFPTAGLKKEESRVREI